MNKISTIVLTVLLPEILCCGQTAVGQQNEHTTIINSIGIKLVKIESGFFTMGQNSGGDWDESPEHKVHLPTEFYMAQTEITNHQYEQFDSEHKKLRGKLGYSTEDDEAVVFVSWFDANNFCKWLSEKENRTYRLPTEAEWEYVCRAGTRTIYHTGDELPSVFHKNVGYSWYPHPTRSRDETPVKMKVKQTPANQWGLYDMHGNVEEWCLDWYGPYADKLQTAPAGPEDGDFRVTRGGSHSRQLDSLRSANRAGTLPQDKTWATGFRIVLAEYPQTKHTEQPNLPLNQQNVSQEKPEFDSTGHKDIPYFRGPLNYVKIPPDAAGPLYAHHNHDPGIIECPNGDLLAVWYSCIREITRELSLATSRLRFGSQQWDKASLFWDTPDRNDHAPALWSDGKGLIYHFSGLSALDTWGGLALVMRTSKDSGATWSKAKIINPEHCDRNQPSESVIRAQNGCILLPSDVGLWGTTIHISCDEGKTWTEVAKDAELPTFEAGRTGRWIAGIHAGFVQLKTGELMAFGRGNNINGKMPKSVSRDMGKTWVYGETEFPILSRGQRLTIKRLKQGPIMFVSFTDPMYLIDKGELPLTGMIFRNAKGQEYRGYGMFAALSFDEGKTWPVKKLLTPGGPARRLDGGGNTHMFLMDETHAEPEGYLASVQSSDGLIHIISSKQHYTFNLAWLMQAKD